MFRTYRLLYTLLDLVFMYGFMHSLVLNVPMDSITIEHLAGILMGIYLFIYVMFGKYAVFIYLSTYSVCPTSLSSDTTDINVRF